MKEITICGKQVKLLYCAASENGFEDLTGKSINDLDYTKSKDIMALATACMIAAYASTGEVSPIRSEDIMYHATSKELTDLYLTVLNLRAEWYNIPQAVAEKLTEDQAAMTPDEKEAERKNA